MQLFAPDDPRPIHFLGIGGAGMSALALIARRRGVRVTGCDPDSSGIKDVERSGAEVYSSHGPEHVDGARAVVFTSAVASDHPELKAAREQGIPVVRRAEALQMVVAEGEVVGVAGTHGKTTTTAMLTEMLAAAGRDPTGIAGGRVAKWGGNARIGGDLFVVEADEYDQSFLALDPDVAVINNVEPEHLDCYGSVADLEQAFREFASRASVLVLSHEDPGCQRVRRGISAETITFGTGDGADIRIRDITQQTGVTRAAVSLPDGVRVDFELTVPGRHNVLNAVASLGAAYALQADLDRAIGGLKLFSGVSRRFEVIGSSGGVTVVDDYAHHASEIRATLEAARQWYPERRLVAVFQPHLYSRTRAQAPELGRSLAEADLAVVTEIYPAREKPLPGVSGQSVVGHAREAGAEVEWVPDLDGVSDFLLELVSSGDVVLILGAGSITRVSRELYRRLEERAA